MKTVEINTRIHCDEQGRAWIDDTNIKVIEVMLDHIAYGWSPEEIHFQHPSLSMAQIHAAFSCYYDHQPEFDRLMIESRQESRKMAGELKDSPGRRRLRALGKIP